MNYLIMKKFNLKKSISKLLLVWLILFGVLIFFSYAKAQTSTGDLRTWMDTLTDEIPFGYNKDQEISVSSISATGLTINSPVIVDELWAKISKYTLMFSEYPLSEILDNAALLDQSKEKTFEFTSPWTTVNMRLDVATDWLVASKLYYVSIIPKNANWILWEISNEIRFKLSDQSYGEWANTWTNLHSSAWADMNLANVSHTVSSNKVTLRWTAVDWSDNVDIFLRDPTWERFNKLWTVAMTAERYEFTINRNWEFIVNFMPDNDGAEKRYTFTVTWLRTTTTTTRTWITTVPKVWPAENIAVAIFVTFFLYVLYRRSYRKH